MAKKNSNKNTLQDPEFLNIIPSRPKVHVWVGIWVDVLVTTRSFTKYWRSRRGGEGRSVPMHLLLLGKLAAKQQPLLSS
jgi:hypothetical protein